MFTVTLILLSLFFLVWLFSSDSRPSAPRDRGNRKGQPFKKYFDLDRKQPISEFEEKMIRGMFVEGREVFVTAFADDKDVLRATAKIGNLYSCSAGDNIDMWEWHAKRIGATQIRQYHNHPDVRGRSRPSSMDIRSHNQLKSLLNGSDITFHSYLVYKDRSGLGVVKEFF